MVPPKTKQEDLDHKKLIVRQAKFADIKEIQNLVSLVYQGAEGYSVDMLRGQMSNYPEGQMVAVYGEKIVGYCATFKISESFALKAHTWKEITGGGFASMHDIDGDFLYGMEVCVDPNYRGFRIGQRLYNERKKLCDYYRLKGIVFAGRLPGLSKKNTKHKFASPEEYLELVLTKKLRDPVLTFQINNGFQPIGIIKDYLPTDKESKGYAVHMLWRNPKIKTETTNKSKQRGRLAETVRVATVQYQQRRVNNFEEFVHFVEYFVDVVADYKADFVVFPELFTLQLLSLAKKKLTPMESIDALTSYTSKIKDVFRDMSIRYNINIIAGSHPTKVESGDILNICYVFLRDGSVHSQEKIHPTPNERYWWNIQGGNKLETIMPDCGPIGVMICYDSEFPELARHLVNQGAQILFVPFCTDERQSYLRVRYCCQARAVENQCYVVMSGNVGNLPGVENMDIQYAQSCILTPCDFPFARDGIAADTTPNVETVAFADLRLETLTTARNSGTVMNLKDRRFDLYSVNWHKS